MSPSFNGRTPVFQTGDESSILSGDSSPFPEVRTVQPGSVTIPEARFVDLLSKEMAFKELLQSYASAQQRVQELEAEAEAQAASQAQAQPKEVKLTLLQGGLSKPTDTVPEVS